MAVRKRKKKKSAAPLIALILILALAIGAAVYVYTHYNIAMGSFFPRDRPPLSRDARPLGRTDRAVALRLPLRGDRR